MTSFHPFGFAPISAQDQGFATNEPPVWITPPGNLGTIYENEKSIFAVEAKSSENIGLGSSILDQLNTGVTYEFVSGDLPPGLNFQEETGHICGIPFCINSDTTYNFTIAAIDIFGRTLQGFSIEVKNYFNDDYWNIDFDLTGFDKLEWHAFVQNNIPSNRLFWPLCEEYGYQKTLQMYMLNGVFMDPENYNKPVSSNEPINAFAQALGRHHKKHYVLLGPLESAIARDKNGDRVYDVVYRRIKDPYEDAFYKVPYPQANTTSQTFTTTNTTTYSLGQSVSKEDITVYIDEEEIPVAQYIVSGSTLELLFTPTIGKTLTVYYLNQTSPEPNLSVNRNRITPSSIRNMRRELKVNIGIAAQEEKLPRWMESEQVEGDPSSIPGFTPAIPIAYLQPGFGPLTINEINDDPFENTEIIIDRYHIFGIMCSASLPTTFDSGTTTFDNDLTNFDGLTEGFIDKYVKFKSDI